MGAFDEIINWEEILKKINILPNSENNELFNIINENEQLQNFISKVTPLNNIRIDALKYLLDKIKNPETRELTITQMISQTGDCSTPVKDFLSKIYILKSKEEGIEISDILIQKDAILGYIKRNKIKLQFQSNEQIERCRGLANALFLENSENRLQNKCKISNRSGDMESDTNYINFSFR